jgi:purine-binding chemotaxis protein CheW
MAETGENEIIDERQYIVVKLGEEQFGIDIKYVDNIVRMQRITRVPKAQHYFKGVINLRGEVIPVMSLRLKFGLEDEEYKNSTRIIIIKLEPQSAIGIIVDEVREVVNLSSDSIEKVQYDANGANDDKLKYLNGIGKHNNGLISILNIANVIIEKEEKAM